MQQVYDITAHINNHPVCFTLGRRACKSSDLGTLRTAEMCAQGWECSCGISTVLAIMRTLGTDCSEEFDEVHPVRGDGQRQLPGFYIGDLVPPAEPAAA